MPFTLSPGFSAPAGARNAWARAEFDRLHARLDLMYEDKLDGKISPAFYERRSAEWQAEQVRLLASIDEYRAGHQSFLDEGVKLLELAQSAHSLYLRRDPAGKRQLLDFLLLNSTWANGELTVT